MTPAETFIEWLKLQAKTEGDSSRQWADTDPENERYHAGAANAFLEVQSYVERHPEMWGKVEK